MKKTSYLSFSLLSSVKYNIYHSKYSKHNLVLSPFHFIAWLLWLKTRLLFLTHINHKYYDIFWIKKHEFFFICAQWYEKLYHVHLFVLVFSYYAFSNNTDIILTFLFLVFRKEVNYFISFKKCFLKYINT